MVPSRASETSAKHRILTWPGPAFTAKWGRRCYTRPRMAESPDRLVGEVVDERWKLIEQLGAGGMGVVYRAERVKLGKQVAIKFLDERAVSSKPAVARFDREARAISRLHHRHCVSILDF